jgi:nicotinamidase-related amidase
MSLEVDISKTALVLIDLQNAVVGRDLAPHKAADVVTKCRQLADAVRAKGGTVVYVHVLIDEFVSLPADAPSMRPSTPLPASASEIVPEAGVQEGDVIVAKRQWGAFYGTNLEQALDRRGVETIVIAGIATNMGVESTARAAFDAGYALVFAEDAMSTMSAEWHEFSVRNIFPRMGRVRSTEEIMAAL